MKFAALATLLSVLAFARESGAERASIRGKNSLEEQTPSKASINEAKPDAEADGELDGVIDSRPPPTVKGGGMGGIKGIIGSRSTVMIGSRPDMSRRGILVIIRFHPGINQAGPSWNPGHNPVPSWHQPSGTSWNPGLNPVPSWHQPSGPSWNPGHNPVPSPGQGSQPRGENTTLRPAHKLAFAGQRPGGSQAQQWPNFCVVYGDHVLRIQRLQSQSEALLRIPGCGNQTQCRVQVKRWHR
ncbi:hypothetical protein THAOC_29538 [Thalassiosira oceanica]|uniref:Uncharacterized protein n=1 Tax=Thalassiosira oceanica TaxID=159749 RepID=K0RG81_THAOC|nr:hypothetical protein THAOC_29538 [Thalassiosira oceanica]|eukprot:EJK51304.1 hypothetical protein THAOC_29538 [Thalassiosira oceanica]